MPGISIIVPIYNGEAYIEKCIKSILTQTYSDIEVLLIDDGSTDQSLKICNEFAETDSRIKVLSFENAGISTARNRGIRCASGKYVMYADADDWLEVDACRKLYDKAEQTGAEVLICSLYVDKDKSVIEKVNMPADVLIYGEQKRKLLMTANTTMLLSYCPRCFYRNTEKFRKIQFPVGQRICEDEVYNLYMFYLADTILFYDEPVYHYYIHNLSIMHKYKAGYTDLLSQQFILKKDFYKKHGLDEYYSDLYQYILGHILFLIIWNYMSYNGRWNLLTLYKEMHKLRNVAMIKESFDKEKKCHPEYGRCYRVFYKGLMSENYWIAAIALYVKCIRQHHIEGRKESKLFRRG